MGWLEALTSVVGSVAWPAVAVVGIVVFRKQLGDLVGRIKSAEIAGSSINFGEQVAEVERSVDDLRLQSPVDDNANQREGADGGALGEAAEVEVVDGAEDAPDAEQVEQATPADENAPADQAAADEDAEARSVVARYQGASDQDIELEWEEAANLASVSGSAAVLQSYRVLEESIRELALMTIATDSSTRPPSHFYLNPRRTVRELVALGYVELKQLQAPLESLSKLRNEVAHTSVKVSENEALGYADLALSLTRVVRTLTRSLRGR